MDVKQGITVQVIVGERLTMGAMVRIAKDSSGGAVIEPIDDHLWEEAKKALLKRTGGCFTGDGGNGTLSSNLSLQGLFRCLFQAGVIVL